MHKNAPVYHPESEHEKLITEAMALSERYEGDEAIWQALTNFQIENRSERIRLFK